MSWSSQPSLLKSQIAIHTWADWDNAVPGFVEIYLIAHEGGNVADDLLDSARVDETLGLQQRDPRRCRRTESDPGVRAGQLSCARIPQRSAVLRCSGRRRG